MSRAVDLDPIIRKAALLNAVKHDGHADPNAVMGKLLAEKPEFKFQAATLIVEVRRVVAQVNSLSQDEQNRIVEENWPEELTLKREKEAEPILPPLQNADKYAQVVTRFSPNPNFVLQLGHSRALILSHDYARMYKGKFLIRFEDTDPRTKRPGIEYYDLIREDIRWVKCEWDEEYIQSDRISIYYEHAKKLLELGGAYVCTCDVEAFRARLKESISCPCRDLPANQHLGRWEKMVSGGYTEHEAVYRVKTDLNHPNPAVRDWAALRVIDVERFPHPRVGDRFRVWPLYNWACGIDDYLLGITHILRGKEHLTNEEKQHFLYRYFGWHYPEAIHHGRLAIEGVKLSKSEMAKSIREGLFKDFTDPQLATLAALRRRGIQPEAIRKMIWEVGPRAVDATISWENLYAINRKLIDSKARRYFFVSNPLKLEVHGLPSETPDPITADLRVHPDLAETRRLVVRNENGSCTLLVSEDDRRLFKPESVVRLMDLFNVKTQADKGDRLHAVFHSEAYDEARKILAPLIHWLPSSGNLEAVVKMPNGEVRVGFAESNLGDQIPGSLIQLVRFGFSRLDNLTEKLATLYFAHS